MRDVLRCFRFLAHPLFSLWANWDFADLSRGSVHYVSPDIGSWKIWVELWPHKTASSSLDWTRTNHARERLFRLEEDESWLEASQGPPSSFSLSSYLSGNKLQRAACTPITCLLVGRTFSSKCWIDRTSAKESMRNFMLSRKNDVLKMPKKTDKSEKKSRSSVSFSSYFLIGSSTSKRNLIGQRAQKRLNCSLSSKRVNHVLSYLFWPKSLLKLRNPINLFRNFGR
jgi:hypothetical protein